MPEVRLYGSPLSPFVEKVARALRLKRIAFELIEPRSPFDLRRHNPETGKMPAVRIDGRFVHDSTFILRALDEIAPEPPLFDDDPRTAALQRRLEDWSDEALYWWVMALRWSAPNRAATTEQIVGTMPALVRPLARLVVPRQIGSLPWSQGLGRLPHDVLVHELGVLLDDLVLLLGERAFFFSDRCGAADLAIHGQLSMALSGPTPEVVRLVEARPALVALRERVGSITHA